MHLINAATLKLTEFPDSALPEDGYAILSHRWFAANEEVSYNDMSSSQDVSHKKGYAKLQNFCRQALSHGCNYAWSDTCCIDKASATELGSALNSMFRWYAEAKTCIVYLADVHADEDGNALALSEWFQRGWTLQELIAPENLSFFDRDWNFLGTKWDHLTALKYITGIPRGILGHTTTLRDCSIAQRMSWAAERITQRIEDRAYSLIGIFDISLGMIYGEREKAFFRLQREIMQHSADQSIFAWRLEAVRSNDGMPRDCISGLLAPSPIAFAGCNDIIKGDESREFRDTNIGLSITLWTVPYYMGTYLAFLDCRQPLSPGRCAITIAPVPESRADQWMRVYIENAPSMQLRLLSDTRQLGAEDRKLFVQHSPSPQIHLIPCFSRSYGFWLRRVDLEGPKGGRTRILPRVPTSSVDHVLMMKPDMLGTCIVISFEQPDSFSRPYPLLFTVRWIILAFNHEFQPVVLLMSQWTGVPSLLPTMHERLNRDFDQAWELGPDSAAHERLFREDWLLEAETRGCNPTPGRLYTHNKCSIIVHDTPASRSYTSKASDIEISVSLLPDTDPIIARPTGKTIWTIDLVGRNHSQPLGKDNG